MSSLHCASTSSGPLTMNIGAANTGSRRFRAQELRSDIVALPMFQTIGKILITALLPGSRHGHAMTRRASISD
jgi:hypothetical protein